MWRVTCWEGNKMFFKFWKGDFMAVALNSDYSQNLKEQKKEVQDMVLVGFEQIKEGKTKGFNSVCDRLEKKYKSEAV